MPTLLTDRSFKVRAGKILKQVESINSKSGPSEFWEIVNGIVDKYFDNNSDKEKFYSGEFGDRFVDITSTKIKIGLKNKKTTKDPVEETIDSMLESPKASTKTRKPPAKKPGVARKVARSTKTVEVKPTVKKPIVATTPYCGEKAAEDIFPPKASKKTNGTDIVISFDDTGSMSACRNITRSLADKISSELLVEFGDKLNVGVIIHGDYCDGPEPVVSLPLSKDWVGIKRFLDAPRRFGGGDAPECYEAVLHEAYNRFDWRMHSEKILVVIGDEVPHEPSYHLNKLRLDWEVELDNLVGAGVKIISVQALNRRHADRFYSTLAKESGGHHLQLTQLDQIVDLLKAICYRSCGELEIFERKIDSVKSGRSPAFRRNLDVLAGRATDVKKIDGLSDFQMFTITKDTAIREYVESMGLTFKKGCGYYEFMKPEDVQDYKQVVVQDRTTEIFYPDAEGRSLLRLPSHGTIRINPKNYDKKYRFFIQSTSYNRVLKAGTTFLYDNRD